MLSVNYVAILPYEGKSIERSAASLCKYAFVHWFYDGFGIWSYGFVCWFTAGIVWNGASKADYGGTCSGMACYFNDAFFRCLLRGYKRSNNYCIQGSTLHRDYGDTVCFQRCELSNFQTYSDCRFTGLLNNNRTGILVRNTDTSIYYVRSCCHYVDCIGQYKIRQICIGNGRQS